MGAYTLLQDLTVSSNSTSVVLNNFGTITKDDFVKVVATFTNGSSSTALISLFPNTAAGVSGHNTSSNYTRQSLVGFGSSVEAARSNINLFNVLSGSQTTFAFGFIKMSENGKFNSFATRYDEITSGLVTGFVYTTSSNLTFNDPITSLTFTSSVTNGLGTGSRIQIYKLDAEKVADITVASNTTQVDISNLSIDKDSEYLLVSDSLNTTATNANLSLCVNDDTTVTNYFTQLIQAFGSTRIAVRQNDATYLFLVRNNNTPTPTHHLSYTHIKLSNIGAYTYQSYVIGRGTSAIELFNYFGSSTAENITSITKLNIVSDVSNAIAAGSRFTLYKLYE